MKKRYLFLIIVLLFIGFTFTLESYASNTEFSYRIENNYAIITAYNGSNSVITIPNTIDGYSVKKIDNHAFNQSRNTTNGNILKKVIISEGIVSLGDFSFVGCYNLESISLPNSLTSLGDQTFIGCTNLKTINIPSKITKLGYSGYMFQETGFTEITIPANVTQIPSETFRICKNLKKVIVHSNNVSYGSNVFEHCSSNLVLYGNEGSTTQIYAQQNGLNFQLLSNNTPTITVSSITLSKSTLSMFIGTIDTLSATVLPADATNKKINWSTSNSNIVSVENRKNNSKSRRNCYNYSIFRRWFEKSNL